MVKMAAYLFAVVLLLSGCAEIRAIAEHWPTFDRCGCPCKLDHGR
jgi:uncharacterized protein YceK